MRSLDKRLSLCFASKQNKLAFCVMLSTTDLLVHKDNDMCSATCAVCFAMCEWLLGMFDDHCSVVHAGWLVPVKTSTSQSRGWATIGHLRHEALFVAQVFADVHRQGTSAATEAVSFRAEFATIALLAVKVAFCIDHNFNYLFETHHAFVRIYLRARCSW